MMIHFHGGFWFFFFFSSSTRDLAAALLSGGWDASFPRDGIQPDNSASSTVLGGRMKAGHLCFVGVFPVDSMLSSPWLLLSASGVPCARVRVLLASSGSELPTFSRCRASTLARLAGFEISSTDWETDSCMGAIINHHGRSGVLPVETITGLFS